MATATDIHTWQQGARDYRQGLTLLKALGDPDDADLFLLELGETAVSRRTLEQALASVLATAVKAEKERTTVVREVVTKQDILEERRQQSRTPHSDGYDDGQLPAPLRELRAQVKADLQEMSFLRSRLELLPSDADRYRDALRVVELDQAVASAYARLDAWKATGRDPGDAKSAPAPKGAADMAKELRNIISYISRANSGQRKSSPEQVACWKARKDELESLLNAL